MNTYQIVITPKSKLIDFLTDTAKNITFVEETGELYLRRTNVNFVEAGTYDHYVIKGEVLFSPKLTIPHNPGLLSCVAINVTNGVVIATQTNQYYFAGINIDIESSFGWRKTF
jgi:hypothetical protein